MKRHSVWTHYTLIYNEDWELIGYFVLGHRRSIDPTKRVLMVTHGNDETNWYFDGAEGAD